MNNVPKVGLIVVMDPRINPDTEKNILKELYLKEKISENGVCQVIYSGKAVKNTEEAIKEVKYLESENVCGIIYYTAWFLRANVIASACQSSNLPVMVWSLPSMNNASVIGFAVTHGALDELGINHEIICDVWNEKSKKEMLAWIRASYVKKVVSESRYCQIGSRCLSMIPCDTDANQWKRIFGIDVDHAEQWTLIHKAEKVSDKISEPFVNKWKKEFASVDVSDEVLRKSAKLYIAGKEMFEENKWDFVGIKCQFEMIDNYLAPCLPIALWNDDGFVVACESDMNAALTMFVLKNLSGDPVMFSDIQYINSEEKWARFLNCGTASTRLAGGKDKVDLKNCPEVQSTYDEKNKIYLCKGGACTNFVLPPGEVTLARFGRIKGKYFLHIVKGESFVYPHDKDSFLGIGGVWPWAYIKIHQDMPKFIQNLRAHHMCISFGNWTQELKALAKLWNIEILQ